MTTTNGEAEFSREESIAIKEWAFRHSVILVEAFSSLGGEEAHLLLYPQKRSDHRSVGLSTIHIVAEEPPVRFVFDCIDWSGCYRWLML